MAIRRSEYLVGKTTDWTRENPILSRGQMGVDSTSKSIKIGDGVTRYADLDLIFSGDEPLDGGGP